jgi:tetratricopeptide (TPR) repeat protein
VIVKTLAGPEPATLIGPSLRGHVYKAKHGHRYFRLLPLEDVSLAQHHAIAQRIGLPFQARIAPMLETGNMQLEGADYVYVSYQASTGQLSLAEILRDADHRTRIAHVAEAIKTLPEWWQKVGEALLLLPADIVYHDQWPDLLALPPLGWWPRISSLLDEPARVAQLAPELIRGSHLLVSQRTIDIFAIGALGLHSLASFGVDAPAPVVLRHAASATLYDPSRSTSRVPGWVESFEEYRNARDGLRAAIDPDPRVRAEVRPTELAQLLTQLADSMDPLAAAHDLREQHRYSDALSLIETAAIHEVDPELLLLGARITASDLGQPIPALEWYERAIGLAPDRPDAYFEQMQILLHPAVVAGLASGEPDEALGDRLDAMLWRDLGILPDEMRKMIIERVAWFFIERGKPQYAQHVLAPYLWQENDFQWWEISLSLAYGEALARAGRGAEAMGFLDGVRQSLMRVRSFPPDDPRFLDPDVGDEYEERLNALVSAIRRTLT